MRRRRAARGSGGARRRGRRHGFEISERAVELASGRPEIERVERFDGATLPAADGAYDLGVLSHVLEHVPDPAPLLRETARVARAVVVEVPLEANRSASRPEARAGARGDRPPAPLLAGGRARARRAAGLRVEAELTDPLPWQVHTFWAEGAAARVKGLAKAAVRRSAFKLAPARAERLFTVHYACLLTPEH